MANIKDVQNNAFSVVTTMETGSNYERINSRSLVVNGYSIADIIYYYDGEVNKPFDRIIVKLHFTDFSEYDFDCATDLLAFFGKYIGYVTTNDKSKWYSHNLFYYILDMHWLQNAIEYPLPKKTCYKYSPDFLTTTTKIDIFID